MQDGRLREPRAGSSGVAGYPDEDTERAALVLEGLAMGAGTIRSNTDNPQGDKFRSSIHDLIDKQPTKSFQRYVEADRTNDLMEGGAAAVDASAADTEMPLECLEAKMKMAREAKEALEAGKELPEVRTCSSGKFEDDDKLSPTDREKNRVCRAACKHDGVLKMQVGPETMLGFGIGWAFAAAQELGETKNIITKNMGYLGAPEREAVLRCIIHSLPSRDVASQLITVYETRVRSLAGHVVHIPSLRKEMEAFYDLDSVDKRARVINIMDPGWLSMFLMVLVLALRFYPCYPDPEWIPCDSLFDGKTVHIWFSAAKSALVLARYQSSQSIAVLQVNSLRN